jgi:azurin
VSTVDEGDFFGHPSSLKSAGLPGANTRIREKDIPVQDSLMMHEAVEMLPELKMPSVRLPHGVMGTSLSWILEDTTSGAFGPFEGQLFVADQGQSKIMRIFMEEVKGEGFESGIIRSTWGIDGSMFVGMSDRGWNALGTEPDGLQRLVWTGKTPFEVKAIQAKPDGFELEFTKPVDPETARVATSYELSSFDYLYRKEYGSPLIDQQPSSLQGVILSEDRLKAQLVLKEPLRAGYIYQITTSGIQSEQGENILHPEAFYSLNQIPSGPKASLAEEQVLNEQQPKSTIETEEKSSDPLKKHQTSLPEGWENGADQVVNIGTNPGLKYDIEQFQVKAGSKIKLVFTNSDDMLHNMIITPPGQADPVGEMALDMGIDGPKNDYVPSTDKVLFYTSLLQPGSSQSIYFTAPSEPGDYQYVCTYPGHYITMRGIMQVVR